MERAMWENIMVPVYGAPEIKPHQWRDTMASCLYRGLPGSLDKVGDALDLDELKDKGGKDLINKLCKPKKATQKYLRERYGLLPSVVKVMLQDPKRYKWPGMFLHHDAKGKLAPHYFNNDPALLKKFYAYSKQDVRSEIAVHHKVCQEDGEWLPPKELDVWFLDQEMNSRGVCIDQKAAAKAIKVYEEIKDRETAKLRQITGEADIEVTSRDQILAWVRGQGVDLPNMQKATLNDALDGGELPEHVADVIRIRLMVGRASVLKLYAMMLVPCKDGKARGLLNYFGASTGRWAGKLIQPQNLARPNPLYEDVNPEDMMRVIAKGDVEFMELISDGDAVDFLMSAMRHFFVADEGHEFLAGDFAAIESVVLFSMAGQEDMVQAIREGKRLYSILATQIYGYTVTKKTHPVEDAAGKAGILGLGYQMGAKALQAFAKLMGIELDFETCQKVVDTYRTSNTKVKGMWNGLNRAAVAAMTDRGEAFTSYGVTYQYKEIWGVPYLIARLPSGRDLHYPYPTLELAEVPWSRTAREDWAEGVRKGVIDPTEEEEPEPEYQNGVSYWTVKLGRWMKVRGYGGHFVENVVQAVARDLLVDAMLRLRHSGHQLVLTVHDEIVAITKDRSISDFEAEMAIAPDYAKDWPITVEAWKGREYRK